MIAPFMRHGDNLWLAKHIQGGQHSFRTLPAPYLHDRSRAQTGLRGWLDYFHHAWRALHATPAGGRDGIITLFPQLPLAVGLLSIPLMKKVPVIAWTFNIGVLPTGLKRTVSRLAFRRIDAFIVHSTAEIDKCSECFGIDRRKLVFVPLQTVCRYSEPSGEATEPYLIAMGSAGRDYALLFEVLRELPVKTIVIAGAHAVAGLDVPDCVDIRSGLSRDECLELLRSARISVVPVKNESTASGQVTLLDSMASGVATIATRCPGSIDYVVDGVTAILVGAGNASELREAISRAWHDEALRDSLARAGETHAYDNFSEEAVARRLKEVCDAVENHVPPSYTASGSAVLGSTET